MTTHHIFKSQFGRNRKFTCADCNLRYDAPVHMCPNHSTWTLPCDECIAEPKPLSPLPEARIEALIGYYDGSGPYEHPSTTTPATLAALRELLSLRQRMARAETIIKAVVINFDGDDDFALDDALTSAREFVGFKLKESER